MMKQKEQHDSEWNYCDGGDPKTTIKVVYKNLQK